MRIRKLEGHKRGIHIIEKHPTLPQSITASWDGGLKVWDMETGDLIQDPAGHPLGITAVAWNEAGTLLASGGKDRTVRVWSVETGELVWMARMRTPPSAVRLTNRGQTLVALSAEGHRLSWDLREQVHQNAHTLAGTLTNFRVCRGTMRAVPVVPFPAPETVWAPEAQCKGVTEEMP